MIIHNCSGCAENNTPIISIGGYSNIPVKNVMVLEDKLINVGTYCSHCGKEIKSNSTEVILDGERVDNIFEDSSNMATCISAYSEPLSHDLLLEDIAYDLDQEMLEEDEEFLDALEMPMEDEDNLEEASEGYSEYDSYFSEDPFDLTEDFADDIDGYYWNGVEYVPNVDDGVYDDYDDAPAYCTVEGELLGFYYNVAEYESFSELHKEVIAKMANADIRYPLYSAFKTLYGLLIRYEPENVVVHIMLDLLAKAVYNVASKEGNETS